jgi:hypothetical protein
MTRTGPCVGDGGNVLQQLLDPAPEEGAQLVKVVGGAVVALPIGDLGQGAAVYVGRGGDLVQRYTSLLPKLQVGDSLFEEESNHGCPGRLIASTAPTGGTLRGFYKRCP